MPADGVVTPTPAASVVVLRRADPFEVLVVKRRTGGTFGDLVVFPGGTVDEADRLATNGDDDGPQRVAALRELAEETGLLALDGGLVAAGWRGHDTLATDSLVMISRWVTPEVMPYRFDTWFYLLVVEDPPEVVVDGREVTGHAWVEPRRALKRAKSGEWQMILPTLAHLRWLARRRSPDDALDSARGADGRSLIVPRVMPDGSLLPVHLPSEDE